MTQQPITIDAANGQQTLKANLVDSAGNPEVLTGYNYLWAFTDPTGALAINGPLANSGTIQVTPVLSGTITASVQGTKSGSSTTLTDNFTITVIGAPAGIVVTLGS